MMDWVPKGTKAADPQKMPSVPGMVWNALVIKEWGPNKNDHLKYAIPTEWQKGEKMAFVKFQSHNP